MGSSTARIGRAVGSAAAAGAAAPDGATAAGADGAGADPDAGGLGAGAQAIMVTASPRQAQRATRPTSSLLSAPASNPAQRQEKCPVRLCGTGPLYADPAANTMRRTP